MLFNTRPTTVVATNCKITRVIAQLTALNTTDTATAAQAPSSSRELLTSTNNKSSKNNSLSVIRDKTNMSLQERQARVKAQSNYCKDLKAQSNQLTQLRKAARY